MKDRQTIVLLLAILISVIAISIAMFLLPKVAEPFIGIFAPNDTLSTSRPWFSIAVNDTSGSGNVTNPTTFKAILYMNGVVFDSVGMGSSRIAYWFPRPGLIYGTFDPKSGGTYCGTGFMAYWVTIQGLTIAGSNSWQVDSLMVSSGNLAQLDEPVSAAKTLTAASRTLIADTVWAQPTTEKVATLTTGERGLISLSVWTYVLRTLTSGGATIPASDMAAIADSVWGQNIYNTGNLTTLDGLKTILGLSQHNYYIDDADFIGSLMTQCRVRIYSDTTSVGTLNNVTATYRVTTTYDGNNLETYKVVKE